MTENAVLVYGNGCGIRTEIDQCTARTLFNVGQYGIGQYDGRYEEAGNFYFGLFKAGKYVSLDRRAGYDVEEMSFNLVAYHANRVNEIIVFYLVFLWNNIQNIQVLIMCLLVTLYELIYNITGDNGFGVHALYNEVLS